MMNLNVVSQSELESYLWGAATLLRGYIDAGDYKQFIFPLLFYKRLCDVYDEELTHALEESGGDKDYALLPEQHRFCIPEGAHWNVVRTKVKDVGKAIQDALRDIEKANPDALTGIFGDAQWTNKDRLPDAMLRELMEHFSSLTLSLTNCPEDELGVGYEFLIKKFADDSGHTAAEFYTNRTVVHLMTEILQPVPGESVYDPTSGSAGMLLSCVAHLKGQGKEWRNLHLYGQELNLLTSGIGRMNLFLHGIEDFHIVRGDTLAHPAFVQGDRLMQFDIVLANPPYSVSEWDRDAWQTDRWGRNIYGTPPQGRADYAFQQHILASLKPVVGRSISLLPHGVLNRLDEQDIRRRMVETDVVEAVIGLGRKLFYNSGMESCLLVCRKSKPPARKGKVLFIEAENFVRHERSQSFLSDSDIQTILAAYRSNASIPGLSALIPLATVLENAASLNIKSYVSPKVEPAHQQGALRSCVSEFRSSSQALREGMSIFLGGVVAPDDESDEQIAQRPPLDRSRWRTVKLGDVAEEYTSRVDDPPNSGFTRYVGSDCLDAFDFRVRRWAPIASVSSAQKSFVKGDYLFVRRSLYGSDFRERSPRACFDGVCSADILTIRERPGAIADGFLIAVLYRKDLWQFVVANSTGSLTRRIKWKQLRDFEFSLPPIEEQKRIVELLWAGDDAASHTSEALNLLAKTEMTLARDLVPVSSVDVFTGELKQSMCADFHIVQGRTLFAAQSGNGEPKPSKGGSGDTLFFKVADFNRNTEETSLSVADVTFDREKNRGVRIFGPGTVVFPKRGETIFLNKVGVLREYAALDPNLMALVPVESCCLPEYLYWVIKLVHLHRVSETTTLPQLNHKHLLPLWLPATTLDKQREIVAAIGAASVQRREMERHLNRIILLEERLREDTIGASHV